MSPPPAIFGVVGLVVFSGSTLQAEQVVISELMYHPPSGLLKYVEVQNLTATVFDIAEWKLRGGVDYDFPVYSDGDPNDSFLKAFERIVICGVDPATFRAAYGLPAAVRVYGPWSRVLSDGGERVPASLQPLFQLHLYRR